MSGKQLASSEFRTVVLSRFVQVQSTQKIDFTGMAGNGAALPPSVHQLYPGSTQTEREKLLVTHEQLRPYVDAVYAYFGDRAPPRSLVVQEALADAFADRRELVQRTIQNRLKRRKACEYLDYLEGQYKRLHAITREGREIGPDVRVWEGLLVKPFHDELTMRNLLNDFRQKINERTRGRQKRAQIRQREEVLEHNRELRARGLSDRPTDESLQAAAPAQERVWGPEKTPPPPGFGEWPIRSPNSSAERSDRQREQSRRERRSSQGNMNFPLKDTSGTGWNMNRLPRETVKIQRASSPTTPSTRSGPFGKNQASQEPSVLEDKENQPPTRPVRVSLHSDGHLEGRHVRGNCQGESLEKDESSQKTRPAPSTEEEMDLLDDADYNLGVEEFLQRRAEQEPYIVDEDDGMTLVEVEKMFYEDYKERESDSDDWMIDGILVDIFALGTGPKSRATARDNAFKVAAHLGALMETDVSAEEPRPLPVLTLPGGNENYLDWRFTSPRKEERDPNFPSQPEVQGWLRQIQYLSTLRPVACPNSVLVRLKKAYALWGIHLDVSYEGLKLRDAEERSDAHKREAEARRRAEQKAELEERWRQVNELKERMRAMSEESPVLVAEMLVEDFHKRVKTRSNLMYVDRRGYVQEALAREMQRPDGNLDKAKRHAIGFLAYMDELKHSIERGLPWEFPREIILTDPRKEPKLTDRTSPATSPDHFKAVCRQIFRMKLASQGRDDPGAPRALVYLVGVCPRFLLPLRMDGQCLGINEQNFTAEECAYVDKMLTQPRPRKVLALTDSSSKSPDEKGDGQRGAEPVRTVEQQKELDAAVKVLNSELEPGEVQD